MKVRSKWLSVAITLLVITSMALLTFATSAKAAPARATSHAKPAHKAAKKTAANCKTRTKASGTVIYSDVQFPDNLNTKYQSSEAVSVETSASIFDGLLFQTNKAKLLPDEATAVPTLKNGGISKDGKTYTFHLKKGLHWSNGEPLISADWKFGFAIDSDKITGPYCLGSCDVISKVLTPNKYTLIFKLKHVFAPFLYSTPDDEPLSWPGGWSKGDAHAAAVKLEDPTFNYESPNFPTDGAYQVSSFVQNDRITLKPNPRYTALNCGAAVKNLIFSFYSNPSAEITAAAQHKTDVALDFTLQNVKELNTHKGAYKVFVTPAFFIEHLEFNHDKQYGGKPNPVANTKVRVALALAVNKPEVLQSALGVSHSVAAGLTAYTFLTNTKAFKQPYTDTKLTGQWDPIIKKYIPSGSAQAVKDAKTLLKQAGYSNGFTVDFDTTTAPTTRLNEMASVCANWTQLKVNCHTATIPAGTLFGNWDENGTLDHGMFQVALYGLVGNNPDPDGFRGNWGSAYVDRYHTTHSATYGNYAGIQDKVMDRGFKLGGTSLNPKVRQHWYNIVQQEVNQQAHIVPLYYRPTISTCDKKVINCANSPFSVEAMWNTVFWKVGKL